MTQFDVIVLGLGGMGSATCYQLARRGAKVLGIEQYGLAHAQGSSHGKVRLIRRAYFEHSDYVPLLNRSYSLWHDLEVEAKQGVFHQNGLLMMGPDESDILRGCEASASEHGIPIEKLDEASLRRRFSQFRVPGGFRGILEPGAGYLEIEKCVSLYLQLSRSRGAELVFHTKVMRWEAQPGKVTVFTGEGAFGGKALVLCAGAWASSLLAEMQLPLSVHRMPQFWFPAGSEWQQEKGTPCFAFDMPYAFLYGFPAMGGTGVKMGDHTPGKSIADPTNVDRQTYPADLGNLERCIRECLPGVAPEPSAASVCLYTMTPDENFIIDKHPAHSNVSYAAGFSGHGFKFASVVGEIMADLSLTGSTSLPIDFLKAGSHRKWD